MTLTGVSDAQPIEAAGAVVWREGDDGIEVVLIHRPKYDDWSFPKGKLDPGEQQLEAAVREVAEETGLRVRLGAPVAAQTYAISEGHKRVHYWSARPTSDADVSGYRPNAEVDAVTWVPLATARRRLTHSHDAAVLDAFSESPFRASPLLVLRHAKARPRAAWQGADVGRPLADLGRRQARALVPLLQAYDVQRVLTSDAARCTATVQPYAREALIDLESEHALSEDGADPAGLTRTIRELVSARTRAVVCSHRPVLPELFTALGVPDRRLEPGGFVVAHRRSGRVQATEQHTA